MKPNIFILTGEIRTGKTTCLQRWAAQRKDVFGIISPVINNERVFMNVQSKEMCKMEATDEEAEILLIGRYIFSKRSFEFAIATIQSFLHNTSGWLLIDECGPLELRGEGLDEVIKKVLNLRQKNLSIVVVVRNSLLNDVIAHYGLNQDDIKIVQSSFFL